MSDKQAWNRQETETAKAFHAFITYRDMPAHERSIDRVLVKFNKRSGYYRQLAKWSSRFQWVIRVKAHDEYLAQKKTEAQALAIKEMAERQAKQGMLLQELGMMKFVRADGTINRTHSFFMEDRDAIKAIEAGVKIERTARGEPTQIVGGEITLKAKSISDYTDEELDWALAHKQPIEARILIEG